MPNDGRLQKESTVATFVEVLHQQLEMSLKVAIKCGHVRLDVDAVVVLSNDACSPGRYPPPQGCTLAVLGMQLATTDFQKHTWVGFQRGFFHAWMPFIVSFFSELSDFSRNHRRILGSKKKIIQPIPQVHNHTPW